MKSLLIFKVKKNFYAINLDFIQRIIQVRAATEIPNAHEFIDGMVSYEGRVIKIVNFRKMTNLPTYEDDLIELFERLKQQHALWVDTLKESVQKGVKFSLTTDSHLCDLGKWLDSFTSYDENVSKILRELNSFHKQLHNSAVDIIKIAQRDRDKALAEIDTNVISIYKSTINLLDTFIDEFDSVADSLQKLLLYSNGDEFALKVDEIIDIAHVDRDITLQNIDTEPSQYLELEGVVELNDILINVIKTVKLPIKEVK